MSKKTIYFGTMLFDAIAVSVAIFLGVREEDILKHFEEIGFLTSISVAQLLATSLLSLMVFWILKNQKKGNYFFWQYPFFLWAIVGVGFFFLAMDERSKIHERIDERIHDILKIQETGITDRIDDLIIALYALLGIAILYLYREEFKRYTQAFPYIKFGLFLLFIMIILDVISNRGDIAQLFTKDELLIKNLLVGLSVIEDSLKIFAEGYFLVGFFTIFDRTKRNNLTHKLRS